MVRPSWTSISLVDAVFAFFCPQVFRCCMPSQLFRNEWKVRCLLHTTVTVQKHRDTQGDIQAGHTRLPHQTEKEKTVSFKTQVRSGGECPVIGFYRRCSSTTLCSGHYPVKRSILVPWVEAEAEE